MELFCCEWPLSKTSQLGFALVANCRFPPIPDVQLLVSCGKWAGQSSNSLRLLERQLLVGCDDNALLVGRERYLYAITKFFAARREWGPTYIDHRWVIIPVLKMWFWVQLSLAK